LINATGTLSYKGAAYLGSLIFFASSAPSFIAQIFTEKRPLDTVAVGAVARSKFLERSRDFLYID